MSISLKANSNGKSGTVQINGIDKLFIESNGKISDSSGNPLNASLKNHIIDGDFNIWYEGTTQVGYGYGSDTMWMNNMIGSTKVHTQVSFANGQTDVPGNPKYFSRTTVTSVAGVSNYVLKYQRIEDVSKISGGECTFSFWAKADSPKNMVIELTQDFGSGGTTSAVVTGIGSQFVLLTTGWTKYSLTVDLPSIAGKTLGTDKNSSLLFIFWFDSGSTYDYRTEGLGQQSGIFDIARVRLVEGSVDGDDIDEDIAETENKISRYLQYCDGGIISIVPSTTVAGYAYSFPFYELMRTNPIITGTISALINCVSANISLTSTREAVTIHNGTWGSGGISSRIGVTNIKLDARL